MLFPNKTKCTPSQFPSYDFGTLTQPNPCSLMHMRANLRYLMYNLEREEMERGSIPQVLTCVAHFRRSHVTDRLKSQKTDCSNPPQDLEIQFWWSHVPLLVRCHRQACCYFQTKFKPWFSAKVRHVDKLIRTTEDPRFG